MQAGSWNAAVCWANRRFPSRRRCRRRPGCCSFWFPFFPSFLFFCFSWPRCHACSEELPGRRRALKPAIVRPARPNVLEALEALEAAGWGAAAAMPGASRAAVLAVAASCQGQVLARLQALLQGTAVVLAATPALAAAQMLHPPGQGLRAVDGLKTTVVGLDCRHVTARAF